MYMRNLAFAVVAGCLLVGTVACVSPAEEDTSPDLQTLWPAPPDEPRYRWVGTFRNSDDIERLSQSQSLRATLTGLRRQGVSFGKPFAVAARGGVVYVTDTKHKVVHAYDARRRDFFLFGFRREGTLRQPLGIATDRAGKVYVVDAKLKRVIVYDRLGLFRSFIGQDEGLIKPSGVAVSPDGSRVYVVDTGGIDTQHHRVMAFSGSGEKLFEFGERGDGPGEFNLPVDAAVGENGHVYVLDAGNFRVQAFTPEGDFLFEWGEVGNGFGQFARPKSIATDTDGKVYVVDAVFGNVQIFTERGRLLMPLGTRDEHRDMPGLFALPVSVATDEKGFVFVLDQVMKKLDIFQQIGN